MAYEYMTGMGIEATSYQDCLQRGQAASVTIGDTTGKAERLRLQGCTQYGEDRGLKQFCCPPLRVRGCPTGALEHYLMNPGESMNPPCFDEGIVQRSPTGSWGRVWCCPSELRPIPSRHGAAMLNEGEQAYNRCVANGGVQAFEDPLTGKPANVANMKCSYSGRLVTKDHRRPRTSEEEAGALREMCCQETGLVAAVSTLFNGAQPSAPAPPVTNGQQGPTRRGIHWIWLVAAAVGAGAAVWFWKR